MRRSSPPSHARRARRRGRGFTLIELMVVVIVLGVLAGMLIPNLGAGIGNTRAEAAARQLADLLAYARQAAVAGGRTHVVTIGADGRTLALLAERPPRGAMTEETTTADVEESMPDPNEPPVLAPVGLPGAIGGKLPEGVALSSLALFEEDLYLDPQGGEEGGARILFFPDGTSEFAELTLNEAGGAKRTVALNGISGLVRVTTPDPAEAAEDETTQEESEGAGQS